ncbi:carbon storage regulator [Pseudomonas sp. MAP12]|uniref:Carbon storage regulator n=1 Tax=Geopseudomonas aromaticivorans TaxID=2849492 RepID=A0ABS6MT84_9GAMM|nr:carbon storage regulator [Pseudomonas aromaticivorans]MBV2132020.1 carbon storage regulator [Pseudomonas aromaticivorans]
MGYLVLARHQGDQIRLTIDPGVDTEKLLKNLLRDGITLHIAEVESSRVRIAVEAPREVLVLREELVISGLNNDENHAEHCKP